MVKVTWAVRWYACMVDGGWTHVVPHRSLVTNIGQDGSGVHGVFVFNGETVDFIDVKRQPVEENIRLRQEMDAIWREGRGRK